MMRGELRRGEEGRVVALSVSVAERFILWLWRTGKYTFDASGIGITDIAHDVLAELLSESDPEPGSRFAQALGTLACAAEPDERLVAAAESIIIRTVHQRLGRVFADIDPLSARLLHALRELVRTHDEFQVFERIDGRWIYSAAADPRLHLPACPYETFRRMLPSVPAEEMSSHSVLVLCLDALRAQEEFRHAVQESDVVKVTVELLGRELESEIEGSTHQTAYHVHDIQVLRRLMYRVIEDHRPWMEEKFIRRSVLTVGELNAFIAAIWLYIDDAATGETQGFYRYLRCCLPGLTHDRYRAEYRSRFEYISRRILSEIWRKWAEISDNRGAA